MDRLDEFFNNKMNERQVPFDETHWQEAQQMLEQRDRRRRGIIWWWWGSGIALVLLLVGLLFWWNRPADQPAEPERSMVIESEKTDDSTAPDASGTASDTETSPLQPSADTDKGQEPPQAQESTATNNSGRIKSSDSDQEAGGQRNIAVVSNQEESKDENDNKNKQGLDDNEVQDGIISTLLPEAVSDQPQNNIKEQAPPVAAIDVGEEQRLEGLKLLPLIDPDALESLRVLPDMKVESITPAIVPQQLAPWEIKLAATANPGEGKAFPGGTAQLQYNFVLHQQYSIYARAGYRFLNGTFGATRESERQAYGFGLSVERYQLTPSRLHYLTAGLGIAKSWKRHRLEAGLAYQHLLGVQGTLSKSEKPEFASLFNNPNEEGSGWMDEEGFRRYLLGGELGYQLRVLGSLSVHFNLQYWWNELLEEGYEPPSDEVLQERGPIFIDLGISYRL